MQGRATPARKRLVQWSARDPHGDSEIPRPTDEVHPAVPDVNTGAESDDNRSEYWHG